MNFLSDNLLTTRPVSYFIVIVLSLMLGISITPHLPSLQPRTAQDAEQCPVILSPQPPDTSSRIIGGQPSSQQLASSMAVVVNDDGAFATGVLVAPTVIITYARRTSNTSKVYIGGQDAKDGTVNSVSSYTYHPSYNQDNENTELYNIMFVRLASPAPAFARPVKVLSDIAYPKPRAFVRQAGYGQIGTVTNTNNTLYQIDVPVLDPEECALRFPGFLITSEIAETKVYCTGYKDRSCSHW